MYKRYKVDGAYNTSFYLYSVCLSKLSMKGKLVVHQHPPNTPQVHLGGELQ